MKQSEIYEKLTAIFRDILDEEDLVLTPELNASDIAAWDSFNHVNIIVATEAAFGIKFKSSEVEELKNVGELVSLIEARTKK